MKQLLCLLVTLCLVLGILLIAVADVNNGYGPAHDEGGQGENTHAADNLADDGGGGH